MSVDAGLVVKPVVKKTQRYTQPGPDISVSAPGSGALAQSNPLEGLIKNVEQPDFEAAEKQEPRADTGTGGTLTDFAKKYIGTPYKWGQSSPLGFDCSGFTQYVFRQFGVDLPRHSTQQGRSGSAVSLADAHPGDLVYWDNPGNIDHVGIYLGNNQVISAPKPGDRVKIQSLYGKPTFRRLL